MKNKKILGSSINPKGELFIEDKDGIVHFIKIENLTEQKQLELFGEKIYEIETEKNNFK